MIQPGDKVNVLHPDYAGAIGTVLEQETLPNRAITGYWLVYIESQDILLALLPREMERLEEAQ